MDLSSRIRRVAEALSRAERILVITGAGLSADSGLPTYRGLGGLYNGVTEEGIPIEEAISGPMLQRDPALCWKYLALLGRACLAARPNGGHRAIARLQALKPQCWVLTQNIDGYHRQAGSPAERLIEIHGEMAPLFCQSCGRESDHVSQYLERELPPRCDGCGGILRPLSCCSVKCCRNTPSTPSTRNCARASMRCLQWAPRLASRTFPSPSCALASRAASRRRSTPPSPISPPSSMFISRVAP